MPELNKALMLLDENRTEYETDDIYSAETAHEENLEHALQLLLENPDVYLH